MKNSIKFSGAMLGLMLWMGACKPAQVAGTSAQTPSAPEAAAVPVAAAELTGTWEYAMTNPDGTLTGTLAIKKGGPAGYSGWIKVKELQVDAETIISRAELQGGNFVYHGQVKTAQGNYPFELSGLISGDNLTGQGKLTTPRGQTVYKVTANRK